mgnify:CR=1 FL=1
MNKVILMGRLTRDPEMKQTPTGLSVARMTIAVNRRFAKDGQQTADFIGGVAWRQTAEFVGKYFSKGEMIIVEGSMRTRTYDDKRYPDVKHYVTEVYDDKVHCRQTKSEQRDGNAPQAASAPQGNIENVQNAVSCVAQPSFDCRCGIDLVEFDEVGGDLPF